MERVGQDRATPSGQNDPVLCCGAKQPRNQHRHLLHSVKLCRIDSSFETDTKLPAPLCSVMCNTENIFSINIKFFFQYTMWDCFPLYFFLLLANIYLCNYMHMGYHKWFREENINVIDRIIQRYYNNKPDDTLQKENSVIFPHSQNQSKQ